MDDRVKKVYLDYNQKIAPLIAVLEAEADEYPIEILNEIRSIFSHLADYVLYSDEKSVYDAESHIKRALLDCYKYICITYEEEISQNDKSCKDVDLTIVSDGSFLSEYYQKKVLARKAFIEAKIGEKDHELSVDDVYGLYEKAYCLYFDVITLWRENGVAIEIAKNRFSKQKKFTILSWCITTVSTIFTAISIFVTIWAMHQ